MNYQTFDISVGVVYVGQSIMPNARFPPFRSRFSVAVSPFPLAVAVHRFAVAYLFAVYGCNGTEFSYVSFFTEQRNFATAERRNGNGRTATEWWKPGITLHVTQL